MRTRLGEPRRYDIGMEPPPGGPCPLLNIEDAKGKAKAKAYLAALGAATRHRAGGRLPASGPSSTGGDEQGAEDVSIERSLSPLSPTSNAGPVPLDYDAMAGGMARSAPATTAFLPRRGYDLAPRPGDYAVHMSGQPVMGASVPTGLVAGPPSSRPSLASSTTSSTSHTPLQYPHPHPHQQPHYHDPQQYHHHLPSPVQVNRPTPQPAPWPHHLTSDPSMAHHHHVQRHASMPSGTHASLPEQGLEDRYPNPGHYSHAHPEQHQWHPAPQGWCVCFPSPLLPVQLTLPVAAVPRRVVRSLPWNIGRWSRSRGSRSASKQSAASPVLLRFHRCAGSRQVENTHDHRHAVVATPPEPMNDSSMSSSTPLGC